MVFITNFKFLILKNSMIMTLKEIEIEYKSILKKHTAFRKKYYSFLNLDKSSNKLSFKTDNSLS